MKELNEAYAVLSDPEKRNRYDSMNQQYGYDRYDHFRKGYSEQDIFRGSDINQIFEEMTRQFGFRNFNDLFREFYGRRIQDIRIQTFRDFREGFIFTGFPFGGTGINRTRFSSSKTAFVSGLLAKLAGYMVKAFRDGIRVKQPTDRCRYNHNPIGNPRPAVVARSLILTRQHHGSSLLRFLLG